MSNEGVQFRFLHGRLTLRRCAKDLNEADEAGSPAQTSCRPSGSMHLVRLAHSKYIKNFEGAVEIGTSDAGCAHRFVKVDSVHFLLQKDTEVHRSSTGLEVFLWWCGGDKVLTLWLEE